MEKMTFSATLNAPKEKVWEILWNDATYRQWTAPFCEGSYAITDDYKEGSKVLFLTPDGSGMVSKVAANKPQEFMSFEHLGAVKNGREDTTSDMVKQWAGAHENYTLTETDGITTLLVELDMNEEFKAYFETTWPPALEKIKQLANANNAADTMPEIAVEAKISTGSGKQKIVPFLWYDGQAEAAMNFYLSIFKNSKAGKIMPGPGGTVMGVEFQLEGVDFIALNGGPMFKFTEAISLFVHCEGQQEVDEFWHKLSEGGETSRCGWLKDKFGLSWQVIPAELGKLMGDPDPAKAQKVMQAMMQMTKIDIAALQQAYSG